MWIFHGKDDEDVPLLSSEKFKSTETGLTIIPNVGHGFGIDIDEDLDQIELDSEEFEDDLEEQNPDSDNIALEDEEKLEATKSPLSKVCFYHQDVSP